MAIQFAANEFESFEVSGSVSVETSTSRFDSDVCRAAMTIASTSTSLTARLANSITEGWFTYELSTSGSQTTGFGYGNHAVIYDTDDEPIGRVAGDSSSAIIGQYYDGSSWQDLGTSIGLSGVVRLSIHFKTGVDGFVKFYFDGVLQGENTISHSTAPVDRVVLSSHHTNSGRPSHISQVMVSEEDNRSYKLATIVPTSNGTHTDWEGGYEEVDDVLDINGSTIITSDTANEISTFGVGSISGYADHKVAALITATRAQKNEEGPQDLRHVVRTDGTDHESEDLGPGNSFEPQQVIWEQNPSTSASWTRTEINNLEIGVKSINS